MTRIAVPFATMWLALLAAPAVSAQGLEQPVPLSSMTHDDPSDPKIVAHSVV